jgi:hypothetical protein
LLIFTFAIFESGSIFQYMEEIGRVNLPDSGKYERRGGGLFLSGRRSGGQIRKFEIQQQNQC